MRTAKEVANEIFYKMNGETMFELVVKGIRSRDAEWEKDVGKMLKRADIELGLWKALRKSRIFKSGVKK